MAFLKDIQDKIILGRWRFLNLRPLESATLKPLSIDENGNLGIGEDASGEIGELETRVDAVEDLAGTALQPGDTIPVGDVSGLGTAATANTEDFLGAGYTPAWDDIDNKPTTFPPAAHTHTIAQVTGLQGELDSKLTATQGVAVADGSTVDELLASLRAAGLIAE